MKIIYLILALGLLSNLRTQSAEVNFEPATTVGVSLNSYKAKNLPSFFDDRSGRQYSLESYALRRIGKHWHLGASLTYEQRNDRWSGQSGSEQILVGDSIGANAGSCTPISSQQLCGPTLNKVVNREVLAGILTRFTINPRNRVNAFLTVSTQYGIGGSKQRVLGEDEVLEFRTSKNNRLRLSSQLGAKFAISERLSVTAFYGYVRYDRIARRFGANLDSRTMDTDFDLNFSLRTLRLGGEFTL